MLVLRADRRRARAIDTAFEKGLHPLLASVRALDRQTFRIDGEQRRPRYWKMPG